MLVTTNGQVRSVPTRREIAKARQQEVMQAVAQVQAASVAKRGSGGDSSLQDQIDDLVADVSALDVRVTALEATAADHEARIAALEGP